MAEAPKDVLDELEESLEQEASGWIVSVASKIADIDAKAFVWGPKAWEASALARRKDGIVKLDKKSFIDLEKEETGSRFGKGAMMPRNQFLKISDKIGGRLAKKQLTGSLNEEEEQALYLYQRDAGFIANQLARGQKEGSDWVKERRKQVSHDEKFLEKNPDHMNAKSIRRDMNRNRKFVDSVENMPKVLETAMNKFSMPENVVAYRGIKSNAWADVSLEGKVITDSGFSSLSMSKSAASYWASKEKYVSGKKMNEKEGSQILLKVYVPKGSKAGYVDEYADKASKQAQIVLGRKSQIKVISDTGKLKGGIRVVEAVVLK